MRSLFVLALLGILPLSLQDRAKPSPGLYGQVLGDHVSTPALAGSMGVVEGLGGQVRYLLSVMNPPEGLSEEQVARKLQSALPVGWQAVEQRSEADVRVRVYFHRVEIEEDMMTTYSTECFLTLARPALLPVPVRGKGLSDGALVAGEYHSAEVQVYENSRPVMGLSAKQCATQSLVAIRNLGEGLASLVSAREKVAFQPVACWQD